MEFDLKKVCGTCGVVGYVEEIVTCCQCNQSYEHIYCMKEEPDFIREDWRCDECLANNHVSSITRESHKVTRSKFYTHRVPVSKNTLSNSVENSIQTHHEQHTSTHGSLKARESYSSAPGTGTHGSLEAPESSSNAPDTGNGRSCNAFTSSGTNVKQQISSRMVDNPKLQLIHVEELRTTRGKAMESRNGQTLDLALTRTNQEEVMHSSVQQRTFRNISTSRTSNPVPFLENVGTPIPELQQSSKSPSVEGLHGIFKKVKQEDSVGSQAYSPLSKNPIPTKLNTLVPIKEEVLEECVTIGSKANQSSKSKYAIATYQHTEGAVHRITKFNGNTMNSLGGHRQVASQRNDPAYAFFMVPSGERPNLPSKEKFWVGDFDVSGSVSYVYEQIQAHIGSNVSPKTYTTLCQLPQRIKLKLLSSSDVWPRTFQLDPPDTKDVALYFFPRELHRSTDYNYLLEEMNQSDLAMQGFIGDLELLIFSSKRLPEDSLGSTTKKFLWGVFRRKKRKELSMHIRELIPAKTQMASVGDASRQED